MKTLLILLFAGVCSVYAGNNGFFYKTNYYKNMGWCRHAGSTLRTGDFNGDGKTDLLCHDVTGQMWIYLTDARGRFDKGRSVTQSMKWCGHAGSKLYVGDFNGDRKTDIMCHDHVGNMWIAVLNQANMQFANYWHHAKFWCGHTGSILHLGDFNGDGRTDVLCHDHGGNKWILHAPADGKFRGRTWHSNMGWCSHNGAELWIADFNGDGRDDMMCHDKAGNKWVALATCHGHFHKRTDWHGLRGWCTGHGAFLLTGQFNGDTRADLLCHQVHSGKKWIALARRDSRRLFKGTDWHRAMNWCLGSTGQVLVGDFNGDGKDDMLCHEHNTGKKWISYNHHTL